MTMKSEGRKEGCWTSWCWCWCENHGRSWIHSSEKYGDFDKLNLHHSATPESYTNDKNQSLRGSLHSSSDEATNNSDPPPVCTMAEFCVRFARQTLSAQHIRGCRCCRYSRCAPDRAEPFCRTALYCVSRIRLCLRPEVAAGQLTRSERWIMVERARVVMGRRSTFPPIP